MLTHAADTISVPPMLALVNLILICLVAGSVTIYILLLKDNSKNRLTTAIDKLGLTTVHPIIALGVSLIWLLLFAYLIVGLFFILEGTIQRSLILEGTIQRSFPDEPNQIVDLRWSLLALAALTATLGAVVSLPLSLIRTRQNARQTDVAEQGLVTDRINKAVEGLGVEKTVKRQRKNNNGKFVFEETDGQVDFSKPVMEEVTEPNLEVRIGALYALERISQENDDFHVQIMEILCAYIVNNADRHPNSPALPDDEPPEGWWEWGKAHRTHPPLDVDTALKIIKRRSGHQKEIEKAYDEGKGYRLGLERAPLHALVLFNLDLTGADLSQAQLQGADLRFSKFQGAFLIGAKLQGADLRDAKLQGANLVDTRLQRAVLWNAKFDKPTDTWFANFTGSACASVNFSGIRLTQDQLNSMFGDASTILPDRQGPDGLHRPAHWPAEELGWDEFQAAWRAWQAEIGFQPPKNPQ